MKLLLDTHVFLWTLMDTSRLSLNVRNALLNSENQVFVSAVTFWEIALKYALDKLEMNNLLPSELPGIALEQMGFHLLDMDAQIASDAGKLPLLHKDPFDRMLILQAIRMGSHMVSVDKRFPDYEPHGLQLFW